MLIISDPKTDFSACAFRVDVGSFEESSEYLGLAHFLEHMLFLGSKKYPESDEYENFFNKYGGYSNAWTSDNYTTYNFEISDHSQFYKALDMTTEFFVSPLFTEKYVEKELNAVDSEFKMNQQEDNWRYWAILGQICNPNSLFSRFSMGNRETLEKPGVKERLVDFWKEKYSSNLMHVILLSTEDCQKTLEKAAPILEKVENRNHGPFSYRNAELAFRKREMQKIVKFRNTLDEDWLKLVFVMPYMKISKKHESILNYFEYLLTSEHTGSMCSVLKDKNLSLHASCDTEHIVDQQTMISVEI